MFEITDGIETHAHLSSVFGQPNIKKEPHFKISGEHSRAHRWLTTITEKNRVQYGFDNFSSFIMVTKAAHEYIPVAMQSWRDSFSDRGLEFLEDTLCYLRGDYRKQPLEQVFALIDDTSRYLTLTQRRDLYDKIDNHFQVISGGQRNAELGHYISMWCTKPRGMEDLAWTIYFLQVADNLNG